jgi:hypothetical protein
VERDVGRAIGLLRLRQIQLDRHPDYLVNSYADANGCKDSSSTETHSSRFLHAGHLARPEVGGAALGLTIPQRLHHLRLERPPLVWRQPRRPMSGSAVSTPQRWKEMAKAIRTPEYRIAYAGTGAIWRRTGDSSPKIRLNGGHSKHCQPPRCC